MIKGPVQGKDITILNMYISNNRVSRYMKQKLTELNIPIPIYIMF